jgi:hypothetical protein
MFLDFFSSPKWTGAWFSVQSVQINQAISQVPFGYSGVPSWATSLYLPIYERGPKHRPPSGMFRTLLPGCWSWHSLFNTVTTVCIDVIVPDLQDFKMTVFHWCYHSKESMQAFQFYMETLTPCIFLAYFGDTFFLLFSIIWGHSVAAKIWSGSLMVLFPQENHTFRISGINLCHLGAELSILRCRKRFRGSITRKKNCANLGTSHRITVWKTSNWKAWYELSTLRLILPILCV